MLKYTADVLYPHADKVVLITDNLNTHWTVPLYKAFLPEEAHRIANRFEWNYIPKYGSWLDMAEIYVFLYKNKIYTSIYAEAVMDFKKLISILLSVCILSSCAAGEKNNTINGNIVKDTNKRTLRIATSQSDPTPHQFKIAHPEIEVEITTFDLNTELDKYQSTLSTQLMSGNAPDVFILRDQAYKRFASTDYIYDINKLIETDSSFNYENYYGNIMEAFEVNGKLPVWPNIVDYMLFVGINKDFKDMIDSAYFNKDTISYREMLDVYSGLDESIKAEYALFEGNNIYAATNLSGLIDYDNKKSDFDNDYYIALLEEARLSADKKYTYNGKGPSYLGIYDRWFNSYGIQGYPYVFCITLVACKSLFLPEKEDYVLHTDLGYGTDSLEGPTGKFIDIKPFVDNNGKIYISSSSFYGINANSDNLELAWEYLKFSLTDKANIVSNLHINSLNLNKEINEKYMIDDLTHYIKRAVSGEPKLSDMEAEKIVLTEEQQKDVTRTAEKLLSYCKMPATVLFQELPENTYDILKSFNEGRLSAEQAAEQMQDKVTLYFNE